jgi:hypothetical protein
MERPFGQAQQTFATACFGRPFLWTRCADPCIRCLNIIVSSQHAAGRVNF